MLVTHTYALAKYIFLRELATNENFTLKDFVNKDFFVEVFLSLISAKTGDITRLKDTTKKYRRLIAKYKEAYCEDASYTPIRFPYAQQIALYECEKIQTAYQNNITAHFGNRLRAFLNKLCKNAEKIKRLRQEMGDNGCSKKDIKKAIRSQVYVPSNLVKQAVSRKKMPKVGLLDADSRKKLNDFISSYPNEYKFKEDSIYYDVVASPENHFYAFFKLAEISETEELSPFSCFPLRTSFIPCYMTLDAKIVNTHILNVKSAPKSGTKFEVWRRAVNMNKKAFKHQGFQKTIQFRGTLETDGVAVSIIKQNFDTGRKLSKKKVKKEADDTTTEYIENLHQDELKNSEGRCVLVDPGRRDIMFCLKETSTVEKAAGEKQKLIYTKNERSKRSRHFRSLQRITKPPIVAEAEAALSTTTSKSVNLEKFTSYIKARAAVSDTLYRYNGNESEQSDSLYFHESTFKFHVDDECNLYYGSLFVTKIRGFFPQPENELIDSSANPELYETYLQLLLDQPRISRRLNDQQKIQIFELAAQQNYVKAISTVLEKLEILPFRKLKFSSKLYYDQNDDALVTRLRRKFGQDVVLVFGDWSAPNARFHEPTRNKGLKNMLKKNGFVVYQIDEFKTSSICPVCEHPLEKFKTVANPRPFRRAAMPRVTCHGLLR